MTLSIYVYRLLATSGVVSVQNLGRLEALFTRA